MLLTEINKHIKCNKIHNINNKNKNFNNIFTNSHNVKKFSIFAIKKNIKFSKKYIKDAIQKGAVAIITNKYIVGVDITQYIVKDIDLSIKILLTKLYPFQPLNSVALTGTNGKTSVVWYISQISFLNKIPTRTYGTLGYYVNFKKKYNSKLTTPEFDMLYQTAYSKKKNFHNYIFEASSHGIDQNRLKNFPINIAAITNITQDHLDYHLNFRSYKKTKYELFVKYLSKDGYAILNNNIKGINTLKKKLIGIKTITYGTENSDINIVSYQKKIQVKFFKNKFLLKSCEFSSIELENISCAIACCFCLGIKISKILKNLHQITNPPGRLEKVQSSKKQNFEIFIDYAHTPDALKKILINNTRNQKKPNVLFGCGGNRDKEKRSKMGLIANKYADKVYITDDNPRDEEPSVIRKSIIDNCKKAIEISDREKAIAKAVKDIKKNDVLIIAGKGHEKIQINKKFSILFDDLKIAKQELKKKIFKCRI